MSEVALKARASAYAGLTALIGTRFYPDIIPQNATLPAVAYTRISGSDVQAMGAAIGLPTARYQVTAVATQYSEARDVVTQIKAAFQRFAGTVGNVVVQYTAIENEASAGFDDTLNTFGRVVDVLMVYEGT